MADYPSIQEFKDNYEQKFNDKVVPVLKALDEQRLEAKRKAKSISIKIYIGACVVSIFILLYGFIKQSLNYSFIWVFLAAFIISKVIKIIKKEDFEKVLKKKIMPILLPAFGDFKWSTQPAILKTVIKNSELIEYFEDYDTDDNFRGSYKGVDIKIAESELTYTTESKDGKTHTHTAFKGILISIDIPKNFSGHTIVLDKSNKRKDLLDCYYKIKLEDVEFEKMFNVYSTDQVESRYLLTTAFMQRFKNIRNIYGAKYISCSFLDKTLLIAIPVEKDMFSLGDLDVPVTDSKQYDVLLSEIIAIFEIIEELKLYQNTGL